MIPISYSDVWMYTVFGLLSYRRGKILDGSMDVLGRCGLNLLCCVFLQPAFSLSAYTLHNVELGRGVQQNKTEVERCKVSVCMKVHECWIVQIVEVSGAAGL